MVCGALVICWFLFYDNQKETQDLWLRAMLLLAVQEPILILPRS
jgi:hypothetical protein